MKAVFSDTDCKTSFSYFFPSKTSAKWLLWQNQGKKSKRASSFDGQLATNIVLFLWCFITSLLVWHHLTTINPRSVPCQIIWQDKYEPCVVTHFQVQCAPQDEQDTSVGLNHTVMQRDCVSTQSSSGLGLCNTSWFVQCISGRFLKAKVICKKIYIPNQPSHMS